MALAETLHYPGDTVQVRIKNNNYSNNQSCTFRPNADPMKAMKDDEGEGVECIVMEVDNIPGDLNLDAEGRMEDHDGVSLKIVKS